MEETQEEKIEEKTEQKEEPKIEEVKPAVKCECGKEFKSQASRRMHINFGHCPDNPKKKSKPKAVKRRSSNEEEKMTLSKPEPKEEKKSNGMNGAIFVVAIAAIGFLAWKFFFNKPKASPPKKEESKPNYGFEFAE